MEIIDGEEVPFKSKQMNTYNAKQSLGEDVARRPARTYRWRELDGC
jgi:hypothetical protein